MRKKGSKRRKVMFCARKGETERTDSDDVSRLGTMTPRLEEVLKEQRKLFIRKFGREPGPDDPLFFDPDADTPQFITEQTRGRLIEQMVGAMRNAGVDEGYIYAYMKTGLLIVEENVDLMKPEELEEFEEAIKEYERHKNRDQ
ncbi:MAG TPA: hypothetical protein EYP21_08615 [Syntrophaceae bacterium]|nr:hypothetical protein [Syntrophaceae bacterium]